MEQIDNANSMYNACPAAGCTDGRGTDLTNMKMWEPLLELARSPVVGVQRHAIWIVGTAVQNNPTAQAEASRPCVEPHPITK